MKELVIEAKIENLDTVIGFVESELEAANCPLKAQMQIQIAVEEVFVNIAHYAYGPKVGSAVIRMHAGDETVIEFEDGGMPYNPLENEDPDINAGLDERKIGGLGIFMVKSIMDDVEYRYADKKNILVIKKRGECK